MVGLRGGGFSGVLGAGGGRNPCYMAPWFWWAQLLQFLGLIPNDSRVQGKGGSVFNGFLNIRRREKGGGRRGLGEQLMTLSPPETPQATDGGHQRATGSVPARCTGVNIYKARLVGGCGCVCAPMGGCSGGWGVYFRDRFGSGTRCELGEPEHSGRPGFGTR